MVLLSNDNSILLPTKRYYELKCLNVKVIPATKKEYMDILKENNVDTDIIFFNGIKNIDFTKGDLEKMKR